MVGQEYLVLLNDDYGIENDLLQTKLEELLLAQNGSILDEAFNKEFNLRVAYWSQLVEELNSKGSTNGLPFSLSALNSHNNSGESLTAWSQRGPGWYRDRWLLLKVAELENELNGEGDNTELRTVYRNLTAYQEKVKRRDKKIQLLQDQLDSLNRTADIMDEVMEDLNKEELVSHNSSLTEEVEGLREDLRRRDEKIKELERRPSHSVVKVKNNSLTKYQKLLEQQVELLASKGDLLSMLKRALEEE